MTAAKLRRATEGDAARLGALHVASWQETYAGILPSEMIAALSVDARAAMWRKILNSPDKFGSAAVFLAEDEGRLVGFGCCGTQREEALAGKGFSGEFSAIYVLRSHQEQGIGRSLVAAMAKELLALGHAGACLWVLRENNPARRFYERLDGEVIGEKVDKQHDVPLTEIAYGWRSLSRLIQ
jgi:GNAT superfamily N-acetyltransferase